MNRLTGLEIVVVSAWLGAAVLVAAVVAPAAFRVLPSRTLAGALVGQVLPVIFGAGLVVAILAAAIEARTARPMSVSAWAPFAIMLVACVVAQFIIAPKIEATRAAIGGALDAIDATDPRRVQFGRLHGLSVLCMGVGMIGAASALFFKILRKSS